MVKNLLAMQETWVRSSGWEDPLEKEMVTHSSILAWEIPWRDEPGRLYISWGCKELDTTKQPTHVNCKHVLRIDMCQAGDLRQIPEHTQTPNTAT